MKAITRGSMVHIPFRLTGYKDRKEIERVRKIAKNKFPGYKKIEYKKSKLIKNKELGDWWTFPEILIYLLVKEIGFI